MTRFLFLSNDDNQPSGGRRFLYWIVDTLNENGVDAMILHSQPGFRLSWFENQTRVGWHAMTMAHWSRRRVVKANLRNIASSLLHMGRESRVKLKENDVIVIPETRLSRIAEIYPRNPKILLNQNPYFALWNHFQTYWPAKPNFLPDAVKAVVSLSKLDSAVSNYIFPSKPLFEAQLFIDHRIFHPVSPEEKSPQIAYMPRRGERDVAGVLNMLRLRGVLDGIETVPIHNCSQSRAASILRRSLFFLTFADREGFGLPPAEAMACGCIIIGYHAGGGREYFNPDFCYPIEQGDYLSCAQTVENCINQYRSNPEPLYRMGRAASQYILGHYSESAAKAALINAWSKLMKELAPS